MATDLFGNYYNNPTKSYIYSNLLCNSDSADEMSFDIVDGAGQISTNSEVLASIGLDEVHVPCTQYTRDMKIIQPYGIVYVKGAAQGESYTRKAYGKIGEKILAVTDWQLYSTLKFHIKYMSLNGQKTYRCVIASGDLDSQTTFISSCQVLLEEAKIPLTVSYENGYIYLTGTETGFEFWISRMELFTALDQEFFENVEITDSYDKPLEYRENVTAAQMTYEGQVYVKKSYKIVGSNYVTESSEDWFDAEAPDVPICIDTKYFFNAFLQEDLSQYIPPIKYRNGAMKGVVLVAKYPQYNAENIQDYQLSLKVGHLVDRVEDFYTRKETKNYLPYYLRVIYDVVDSFHSQYELDNYKRWATDPLAPSYDFLDDWIDYYEPMPKLHPKPKPPCPRPEEDENWDDANVPGCKPPVKVPPRNPHTPVIPTPNIYHSDPKDEWSEGKYPYEILALNRMYSQLCKYEVLGLYGYASYLTKHNLWKNIGQLYAVTATEDDPSGRTRNLIDSFIVYNPNPFPVVINYLTFA